MAANSKVEVLILGANGMLGHKLYQVLSKDFDVYGTVRCKWDDIKQFAFYEATKIGRGLEVTDLDSYYYLLKLIKPSIIINCIGIIDKTQSKFEMMGVNTLFPMQLQMMCDKASIRLIHISTDCVFSGKDGKYR